MDASEAREIREDHNHEDICDSGYPSGKEAFPADVVLPEKALSDMPTAAPPTGSNYVLKSSRDPLEYT
ncbi:hypothetical protein EVAR_5373_1 [Eumeta japonica]|uniref:Uncharacterized protein n=1 Tax=Eumeta variegata TaxID=151549 RepID=A0A4C1TMD4_EUMVA|nr:hypothetical protein EVAR_5373_1 [Eumeta japonica]